ncbi:MAG TPA: hypothetical protein VMB05_07485 [Solirubrobacteraceae bacterium]|nr:hypothetical protein [Solirubrobacteraceae bacterium]HUB74480.1 hypothetical protein [Solirubrobacteraceae bacterium]
MSRRVLLLAVALTLSSCERAPAAAARPLRPAPSGPPLTGAQAQAQGGRRGEEDAAAAQVDPLVSNGLGSPSCSSALGAELSRASRRNCETSGFLAAAAPTGDYGIDVHIDTGVFDLESGDPDSLIQDLVVTPLWMALVWAVHALVVMLEWCFTVDLLDSSAAGGVGAGLRHMQATFTEPWLPIALAACSVVVLYHGIARRRIAQTLGEAAATGAMMLAGLWVIADPTGTIGALGRWANEASLGTLAAAAQGSPTRPGGALGESLTTLFAATVELPWCYLEFGDVAWCREPSRLDPALRVAALRIAAQERRQAGCEGAGEAGLGCSPPTATQATALERSVQLLREARTNGAIFLALPANGPARNSINEEGSLLRTLCQSSDATDCRGPTAAQAEFRTNGGTWPRVGGLMLITGGLAGMLALLGFVALRLITASIFSLLYLLAAPAMVLVPACGEGGRALFRRWATQLLGAVISKLVFSFLLGILFATFVLLSGLTALGWWTQWLLIAAFWWGAFLHRHQALGIAHAASGTSGADGAAGRLRAGRLGRVMGGTRRSVGAARRVKARLRRPAPEVDDRALAHVGKELADAAHDEQIGRLLDDERQRSERLLAHAPGVQGRLSAQRARLSRIERARADAAAGADTRRELRLAQRAARVRAQLTREEEALDAARRTARERPGAASARARRDELARFLDLQAQLPAAGERSPAGEDRRDYRALAPLLGYQHGDYGGLSPQQQRAARMEIDRELALRRELREAAGALQRGERSPRLDARGRRAAGEEFERTVRKRMQERGAEMPASRRRDSGLERWRAAGRARQHAAEAKRSSVMHDAHEVAARRKRQLGRDRP